MNQRAWQATRGASATSFGPRAYLFADPSNYFYVGAATPDGLTLYLSGADDVHVVSRSFSAVPVVDAPQPVAVLGSPGKITNAVWLSQDDCLIYLVSNRGGPGTIGGADIFMARRAP